MPVRPEGFKPPVQAKSEAYDKNSSDEDYVQEGVLTNEQKEKVEKIKNDLLEANKRMLIDLLNLQQEEIKVNLVWLIKFNIALVLFLFQ